MILDQWAKDHHIPAHAMVDLYARMGVVTEPSTALVGMSEGAAQQRIQLAAPKHGGRLWRNNVGAAVDDRGRHIRYGLANESSKMNKILKSSDLIGIMPHVVTSADVGNTIGIFIAIEVKRPGWTYKGTEREVGQANYIKLVTRLGGRAQFATCPEDVWPG